MFQSGVSFSVKNNYQHSIKVQSQSHAFYIASQTGNKSALTYANKKLLKKFGIIHLLTPSGIHLSAILGFILYFLPRKFRLPLFICCLLYFYTFPNLYSLKRVLYFQIFYFVLKVPNKKYYAFIFTFVFDLLAGGYKLSPLSYTYSFLFWGTIIFSPTRNVLFNLFKAQLIALYFSQDSLNILSALINPLITSVYTFFFPLMSFNYWLLDSFLLNKLIYFFHNYILLLLKFVSAKFSFLEISKCSILLFIPFIDYSRTRLFILLFLFSSDLNNVTTKIYEKNMIYSLPPKGELLNATNNKLNYLDLRCTQKFMSVRWEFRCKKKPSKYGGLILD